MISPLFDPKEWSEVSIFKFQDITLHTAQSTGAVRIAFNRPDLRNAFRPQTVDELLKALEWAHRQHDVGVILLTGNGPSTKDGGWAFCSGGDQSVRGKSGYEYHEENQDSAMPVAHGRLHILEVQRMIRFMPKVVIALVPGWAVGGGHSLHVVCDLTIASKEHAAFMQTDARVASFDGGFGSAYLARQVGQKRAREVFFLEQRYSAQEAFEMGMINKVVPHEELEKVGLEWARIICSKSPTAIKMLKFGFNLIDDGLVGQQVFAGEATRLAYGTAEAEEGRNSFLEKRQADFENFPWMY
jgi:naphthoate synthase